MSWFTTLCRTDYEPGQDDSHPEKEPFVTLDGVERLKALTLDAIQNAARTGTLARHPHLERLLFHWADLAGDGGVQTRHWTDAQLSDDESVKRFAVALTFEGSSFALGDGNFLGDRVSTKIAQVADSGMPHAMQ